MRRRRDFDSYLAVELWDIATYRQREAERGDVAGLPEDHRLALHTLAQDAATTAATAFELHDLGRGVTRRHVGPSAAGWGA